MDSRLRCYYDNAFVKERLGEMFRFFMENCLFLAQNVFIPGFLVQFEISASKLTPMPNFSLTGQKIRELEFWPGTIPKTAC